MTTKETTINPAAAMRTMLVPMLAAGMIFVLLVPVPPAAMDVMLAANIAVAALIFLTTIFVESPLELTVFPTLLLGTTLLRLALNVATTRLILTAGDNGQTAQQACYAAGHVVWAFSEFVAGGSLVVGAVIFAMIAVIQFVVITKGSGRISEVAARFVLDAMPGKQMAIDSELASGSIDQAQARLRRESLSRESDFYGAMDGASKFIRGDAIAAVVITMINIFGGLFVGLVQRDWSWTQTVSLFTRLTIGDGLVTQLPALLISMSAAILITRSAGRGKLSHQLTCQLIARPGALAVTGLFLTALMFTPLPTLPIGLMAVGCFGLAIIRATKTQPEIQIESPAEAAVNENPQKSETTASAIAQPAKEFLFELEFGYALIPLVDFAQGGDLPERIAGVRQMLREELDMSLPAVKIKDDLRLPSHGYRVRMCGIEMATAKAYPGRVYACGGAAVELFDGPAGKIEGLDDGVWIQPAQRQTALDFGMDVYTPSEVMAMHLAQVARNMVAAPEVAASTCQRNEITIMDDHNLALCKETGDEQI